MVWWLVGALSTLVFEPFDSLSLWTVVDGNGDGVSWVSGYTFPGGFPVPSGFEGAFAVYDDDQAGDTSAPTVERLERVFPLPGFTLTQLVMALDYQAIMVGGETFQVEVSYFSGGTWSTPEVVLNLTASDSGSWVYGFSPAYLGAESLKVAFVYDDGGAWGWGAAVDNLRILGDWELAGDAGIAAVVSPQGWVPDGDQVQIPVRVVVFSNDPAATLQATLLVEVYDTAGGGPLYSQSVNLSLSPLTVDTVALPDITGLPLDDRYRVVATLDVPGDPFTANNTLGEFFDLTPAPEGAWLVDVDLSGVLPPGEYLRGVDAAWGQPGVVYLLTAQPSTASPPTGPHRYFVYRFDRVTQTLTQLFEVPHLSPSGYTVEEMEYALDLTWVADSGFFWISMYLDSAGVALTGQYLLKVDTTGVLLDTLNWATQVDLYATPMGVDWDPLTRRMYVASIPSPGFGSPQVYRINLEATPIYERAYEMPLGTVYPVLAHVWDGTRRFLLADGLDLAFVEYRFDSIFWGDSVFSAVFLAKIPLNGIQGVDFVASDQGVRTARAWVTLDDGAGMKRLVQVSLGARYRTEVDERPPLSGIRSGNMLRAWEVQGRILRLVWNVPEGTPYRLRILDPLGRERLHLRGRVEPVMRVPLPGTLRGVVFIRTEVQGGVETRKVLVP